METNENPASHVIEKNTQLSGSLSHKEFLTMSGSVASIVGATMTVAGFIILGPDLTGKPTTGAPTQVTQIILNKPHENSTIPSELSKEVEAALLKIKSSESKDIIKEVVSQFVGTTEAEDIPIDCEIPWRRRACISKIRENLEKKFRNGGNRVQDNAPES